jgi:hypothetical protein
MTKSYQQLGIHTVHSACGQLMELDLVVAVLDKEFVTVDIVGEKYGDAE